MSPTTLTEIQHPITACTGDQIPPDVKLNIGDNVLTGVKLNKSGRLRWIPNNGYR